MDEWEKDRLLRIFIDQNLTIIPYVSIKYLQNQSIPLNDRFLYAKELFEAMQQYESTRYGKPMMAFETKMRLENVPLDLSRPTVVYKKERKTLGAELAMLNKPSKIVASETVRVDPSRTTIHSKSISEMPDQPTRICKFGINCRDMSDEHRDSYRHLCKLGRNCQFALRGDKRHMSRYIHHF